MMFFLGHGYRMIAHDRRGHGRSTQTLNGHDMDTYAADVAELVKKLDLESVIHIGHSTGGGEVTRYVAKYGKGRVAKAVLISAIPPTFQQSERNPDEALQPRVPGHNAIHPALKAPLFHGSRCFRSTRQPRTEATAPVISQSSETPAAGRGKIYPTHPRYR